MFEYSMFFLFPINLSNWRVHVGPWFNFNFSWQSFTLEIHFLIHRTSQKWNWRGYLWLDYMLQNFKGFLLHLRSTFSFTGPPESANEEDTCGSKICSKNKPIYYTWDPLSRSQDCPKLQVKRILVARTKLILRSLTLTKRSSHCVWTNLEW